MIVNDVLECSRKEESWPKIKCYFGIYLGETEEYYKELREVGAAVEILTQHLLNIC